MSGAGGDAVFYAKYGGNHTGLTANVICYRSKAALREVAKVFGLSDDTIDAINQLHWGWGSSATRDEMRAVGVDPDETTLAMVLECARDLHGFPRHLSQHVGGFVITRDELDRLVPISKSAMDTRAIIEWNKDDIDALGILKVDVLALGMLSCLKRALTAWRPLRHEGPSISSIRELEANDKADAARVFAMTHRADTIGCLPDRKPRPESMLPRSSQQVLRSGDRGRDRPTWPSRGYGASYLKRRIEGERSLSAGAGSRFGHTLGIPLFQNRPCRSLSLVPAFHQARPTSSDVRWRPFKGRWCRCLP